jgi:hypothetical protein
VNSAGKIVLNEANIKMKEDRFEKRVMLRMNRKWMCHMKSTYPEINDNMMSLLRASHEALAFQREEEIVQTVPLHVYTTHFSATLLHIITYYKKGTVCYYIVPICSKGCIS